MPTGTQGEISDPTADRSTPPVSQQSGQPMATPESRHQFRETRSIISFRGIERSDAFLEWSELHRTAGRITSYRFRPTSDIGLIGFFSNYYKLYLEGR
jgi:hypothetical protein